MTQSAMPIPPITVNSCWWGKQIPFEVTVTHVTFRTVSFITVDKTFSDTIPHRLFLQLQIWIKQLSFSAAANT